MAVYTEIQTLTLCCKHRNNRDENRRRGAPKGCHHKAVCAMPKTTRRSHASMKILHALKII